jgi:hypothetical protein
MPAITLHLERWYSAFFAYQPGGVLLLLSRILLLLCQESEVKICCTSVTNFPEESGEKVALYTEGVLNNDYDGHDQE